MSPLSSPYPLFFIEPQAQTMGWGLSWPCLGTLLDTAFFPALNLSVQAARCQGCALSAALKISASLKFTCPPGKSSALTASTAQQNSLVLMLSHSGFLGMHVLSQYLALWVPFLPTVYQPACVSCDLLPQQLLFNDKSQLPVPGAAVFQWRVRRAACLRWWMMGLDVFVVFYKSVRRQKDGRKHHFRQRLLAIWNKLAGT